jgi:hypothetical protein
MEAKFEKQVMEIINNKEGYIGPKQLSSSLINYINNLNAKSVNISFSFPFFYEKNLEGTINNVLVKYPCEYLLRKTALINYKQKYRVELPIIAEQYINPRIQEEIINIPAKIVVELEGFETFFIEDLIEIVDKNLNKSESLLDILSIQNAGLTLIENIESDLYRENDIEWCSVKLINRRVTHSYSVKLSGKDRAIENEKKYAEAYLFV